MRRWAILLGLIRAEDQLGEKSKMLDMAFAYMAIETLAETFSGQTSPSTSLGEALRERD
jgi:hypothetical protein